MTPAQVSAALEVARLVAQDAPGCRIVLTTPPALGFVDAAPVLHETLGLQARSSLAPFLYRHHPRIALWAGVDPARAPVEALHDGDIPLILVDPEVPAARLMDRMWPFAGRPGGLERAAHVLLSSPELKSELEKRGVPGDRVHLGAQFQAPPPVLACNEAERATLGQLLVARPVWLAAGISAKEAPIVVAAHGRAARSTHRLLLILSLDDPDDGPALRDQLHGDGWLVGLRSEGDEPDTEVQIYLADTEDELGLWYRLAPVAFLGRSLVAPGGGIDPMPAAALGAAIVHGNNVRAYADGYATLGRAGAARAVISATQLGAAIEDLQQPERVAEMASAAWQVSTEGADVIARASDLILQRLNGLADVTAAEA